MKKLTLLAAVVLVLCVTSPLHAQIDGCIDSPENPTALLALVGGAGAFITVVRNRVRK